MMDELPQPGQQQQQPQQQNSKEEAADSGGEIVDMDVGIDVEQLPQALRELVTKLREVPPTIQGVDLGGPDQGGDYFRTDPAATDLEDGAAGLRCTSVRLWVLGLIGTCPSLRVVKLGNCGITSESEVERLCQGLKSNAVLQWLTLDGNVGFGSDFGCLHVGHILASSACGTSLEELDMDGVGLRARGLSQLLSTVLANTAGGSLRILDVEHNPECLADEHAAELLAQLVSSKGLLELRIRETGLAVAGAALLSAALGAKALQTLQVGGGPEPVLNVIVSSLTRCSQLLLLCSKEEEEASQLAEPLAQMLRSNTSLTYLALEGAHFSTQAWNGIFQALGAISTLSFLSLEGSTTLDHSVMDSVHQLLAGNPGLTVGEITNAPLKGTRRNLKSRGFFYCICSSCRDSMGEGSGGEILNVEQLPKELRSLVAALTAVPASIEEVDLDGPDHAAVGHMFRLEPSPGSDGMLWEFRLLVLGLIGRCPSLRRIRLNRCNISRESEVERLCQGLASNTVLEHLLVGNNSGFGSDLGCQQVSNILASSSTSQLETLEMWQVGMKGTGLCLLLRALLANGQNRLQVLSVRDNPECLANDDEQGSAAAAELLAQLLTGTACRLRELRISRTGLSVAGATRLSAALAHNTSLRKLQIGGDPILKTILMSSSPINIPTALVLVCPKEEAGLVEVLAERLRTNTTLRSLWLLDAHFSADGWHCIFEALGANIGTGLSYLQIHGSTTLDHRVIDDLHQLCSARPNLCVGGIDDAPLRGNRVLRGSRGGFICYCSSCTASTGGTLELKRLMDELSAPAGASKVARFTRQDWMDKLSLICMPRSQRSEELIAMRRRVLSLMGSCASLKSIQLPFQDVIEEEDREDVEALCSGLASNPVLEELTLDGNRGFGSDFGCAQLATVVSGCFGTLRKIGLARVGMKSSGLRHLIQALLATHMEGSTCIPEMELDISHNEELGDAGAHLVAQLLSSPSTSSAASSLTTLRIANLRMGVSGATSLSLALQHNTNLRTLVVGEPELDGPTTLLLQGLINNPALTRLQLWKGGKKPDKGLADILARLLQQSTTAVGVVEIYDVPFQPQEWRKIFGALQRNEVLEVLEIEDSYDLEAVFNDLMELLQVNTTIEEIHGLEATDLRDKGKIPLVQEALRRNKQQREYVNVLKEKLPLAQPSTGRLFLCGPPYAGKSTLRETMVRCNQQPQAGCTGGLGAFMLGQWGFRSLRPRTEGIEIQVLRNDDGMQISVWDMAGQEDYHALHDCIFPNTNQACMFVFVYNPLKNTNGLSSGNGDAMLPTQNFREMFLYWLRFIASNSRCQGHVLPTVCIVITNLDRLQPEYSEGDVVSWAEQVVDGLRLQFQGVLQILECKVVTAYSTSSVKPVVDYFFNEFKDLLHNKLSPVFKACGDMSMALAKLTMNPKAEVVPLMRLVDFYKMCEQVEDLRHLFQDQPTIVGKVVEEYVTMARAAVAAYLHDVGSIVYFPRLDFVVVNPNWLSNVFLSKVIRSGADMHGAKFLPETIDGFIEELELKHKLENFLKVSKPPCPGFTATDLVQLLMELELCYKDDINSPISGGVRYFVPSSLADGSRVVEASQATKKNTMWFSCLKGLDPEISTSTREELDLEWEVPLPRVVEPTTLGIRLQCGAQDTKFLTAGFFPRLQVCLRKALSEAHKLTLDQYDNRYNLLRARITGCEIVVESSGEDNATFVDILVRSANSKNEIWVLVQKYIIQEIQAFCATPRGCPGVNLVQCIIRPECVGASITPCLRRDAVSVETLKDKLLEYILSPDSSATSIVGDASYEEWHYQHCWPKTSNFNAGYSKVVELLDAQALKDVLRKVVASLAEVDDETTQAVCEVMQVMGNTPQGGLDVGNSDSGQPNDLRKQPTMRREMHEGFKAMERTLREEFKAIHGRLDEHRDILSSIVPSVVRELKLHQRQMKDTFNEIMGFLRDSQNTKLPRFPYLSEAGVGMGRRFVAFLTVAKASKLHFMCEDRTNMHHVENQPGRDLTITKPDQETLRFVVLWSFKVLYVLLKAGLQVGASLGGIVPEYKDLAGKAVSLSSQAMASVLDDIKFNDPHFSARSEVFELSQLHHFLKNDDITIQFHLHRVEYLDHAYDAAGMLSRFGWVCQRCRTRGKDNNTLIDAPP